MTDQFDDQNASALSAIYDAAVDHVKWEQALDALAALTGGKSSALMLIDSEDQAYNISALSELFRKADNADLVETYLTDYRPLELEDWGVVRQQKVFHILSDLAIRDASILDIRADYQFLQENFGIKRRIAVRLNENPAWYDAVTVQFHHSLTDIQASAIARINPLLPHLAKSVEVGRLFNRLQTRYRAALAALNHVSVGLAVARETGEILVVNSAAERILAARDGIGLSRGRRLVCNDPDRSSAIEAFISEASSTARGQDDKAERLLSVPRISGAHPLLIEICPLNDSLSEIDKTAVGALIALIDPSDVPALSIRRFALMCGLTEAEADVCDMMVNGLTGGDIADRRGTSPETVKSQMANVLQKAGVKRRFELIRMVLKTIPPVAV